MVNRFLLVSLLVLGALGSQAQTLRADLWSNGALSQPVAVIQDPTDASVQFIVQQTGAIRVAVNGVIQATSFLTVPVLTGSERGLLGLCFDPDYATNHYFYVYYTRPGVYMQLSRFTRSASDPLVADSTSELRLLRTQRPNTNHNSGTIAFGTDGYLYFGTGDGGGTGDPQLRAQNPNDLLGKMLRIDPRSDDFPADPEANYHIPADNPFVDGQPITARNEIWAFGYRNAWKWSFDDPKKLGTGAMVVADVGQGQWEEVDYEPMGQGGRNYGWSHFEGFAIYDNSHPMAYNPHQLPIHVYDHSVGQSITGGYVYRGLQLGPEYFGRYFFADYVAGRVWAADLTIDGAGEATMGGVVEHTADFQGQLGNVSSFGVDADGELFAVNYGGSVYRIVRPNTTWLTDASRSDGLIVGGQVRSLVKTDGKLLEIAPFKPFFSVIRSTGLLVGAKSNVAAGQTIDVSFDGRVNQTVNTGGNLYIKNWTTGNYDLVKAFVLNGTLQTVSGSVPAADHVRPSDGRIEFKSETSFNGIVASFVYRIQYDAFSVSLH